MKSVLLYPPLTDPTSGYHSLSYLDTYARANGHPAADIVDINIEAFHHTYGPAGRAALADELRRPGRDDPFADYLAGDLVAAHRLRVPAEPDVDAVVRAVDTLRDPEAFYDIGRYRNATEDVIAWMNWLGAAAFPGQFIEGFRFNGPPLLNMGSVADLTDEALLARISVPFQGYYDDVLLPRLRAGEYGVVGVNITYQWQLPFALWLIRRIRAALPDAFLVAGGTEVSDVWKYAADKRSVFEIFAALDAVVVGEGETAYAHILDHLDRGALPAGHPNVFLHPRYGVGRTLPMLRYEPLADLPTPRFDMLPWDSYLSPERFVYYAPTRGCYWNKCTFCDYGLNGDSPTSPWRQSNADRMVRDVAELSKFARFVYFSVDVLAPATVLHFAEKVVEQGIDVRWGAEIRLEKYWSDERCELLRRSGCTAISVGFESGNQRVLNLIDKGTTPTRVHQTIQAMTKAGIGVQIMGFTGFPTETLAEARDSIDFLTENRDLWTFGGLGTFVLTAGAIVAKQPQRFGITNVRPPDGADIVRYLRFDEPISQGVAAEVARAKDVLQEGGLDRPWLGGIDSPHTFFYHDRYGTAIRSVVDRTRSLPVDEDAVEFELNGEFVELPPDGVLDCYVANYGIATARSLPTTGQRRLFRRRDGRLFLLRRAVATHLSAFATPATVARAREQMWMLDHAAASRLIGDLVGRRFVREVRSDAPAGTLSVGTPPAGTLSGAPLR